MYLSSEQERMLGGEMGTATQRLFRLLVRLGDVYGADRMIPVGSVQISGVSYKSIGDPGLEFLEDFAAKGARAKVLSYLNPTGMDMCAWREMGIPDDFAEKQMRIVEAFKTMGVITTATCTPYLAGNLPRFGEHVAWSESSAVSFANSVIGARTNREGGPSALAAAVCGVTPEYGLHLESNRQPQFVVEVEAEIRNTADFGALGYRIGEIAQDKIPYIEGLRGAYTDQLKVLGAAMAASGAVALYHAAEITPESRTVDPSGLERITITRKDIDEAYRSLNSADEPDIVILGCPHASIREIFEIALKLEGIEIEKPLWICTSRCVKRMADEVGLTERIGAAGGRIVADTCMVVSPLEDIGYGCTGVNSAKAAHYLPSFCGQRVVFLDTDELIRRIAK